MKSSYIKLLITCLTLFVSAFLITSQPAYALGEPCGGPFMNGCGTGGCPGDAQCFQDTSLDLNYCVSCNAAAPTQSGAKALGASCSLSSECQSGICNNGVCSNSTGGVPTTATDMTEGDNKIGCGTDGINTALGCIEVGDGGKDFISTLLTLSVGIGGAIALLLMLYGFYILTTSAGMPDKVKAGKEIITSAVSGLIFIILSVVLLNFLGVQVLGLPGF